MNLEDNALVEIAIATVGGLAAVGMVVLRFALRGFEQQQDVTRQLIEERFQWAETQRQDAREHWEAHFNQMKRDDDRLSKRITQIEARVTHIERILDKNGKD